MDVEVLHIGECPNWQAAGASVEKILRELGHPDAAVRYRLIETQEDARRSGFAGSPTILVGGADLFPSDGQTADLACRVYLTPDGLRGMPTEDQIRDGILRASERL